MEPAQNGLGNLPLEILLQIFESIDDVMSTCLGLTCKKFYGIHQSLYKPVRLCKFTYKGKESFQLYQLLETWVPPTIVYRKKWPGMYVRRERYDEIVEAERAKEACGAEAKRRVEEQDLINYWAFLVDEEFRKKKEELLQAKVLAELAELEKAKEYSSDEELMGEPDSEPEEESDKHSESDSEDKSGEGSENDLESGPEEDSEAKSQNGSEAGTGDT